VLSAWEQTYVAWEKCNSKYEPVCSSLEKRDPNSEPLLYRISMDTNYIFYFSLDGEENKRKGKCST
jgi:hypothetical protein